MTTTNTHDDVQNGPDTIIFRLEHDTTAFRLEHDADPLLDEGTNWFRIEHDTTAFRLEVDADPLLDTFDFDAIEVALNDAMEEFQAAGGQDGTGLPGLEFATEFFMELDMGDYLISQEEMDNV